MVTIRRNAAGMFEHLHAAQPWVERWMLRSVNRLHAAEDDT